MDYRAWVAKAAKEPLVLDTVDLGPLGPEEDASTVRDGEPLLGHANGEAVLLVRRGDDFLAIGATCTHYGGPLAEGLIDGDDVRCPWHHACFNLAAAPGGSTRRTRSSRSTAASRSSTTR